TNQIICLPMDPMSGYTHRIINAGDIQNKGFELVADVRILSNPRSLGWSMTANFSKNENKIIDIASDLDVKSYGLGEFDDLFIRAVAGSLYGDIYGTRFLCVKDESRPYFGQLLLDGNGLPQRDAEIVHLGNQQAKSLIGV